VPAVIRRAPKPSREIIVPRRVGLALEPERLRSAIPVRVTLDSNSPPFSGELREEHSGPRLDLPDGAFVTLATLRRPWNYVGIAIDPGDLGSGTGLAVALRILTRGVNGLTVPIALSGAGPQAFVGIIVGATCELVAINGTGGVVHHVRGSIWGMSER
jgi:hypothetical protein